MRRFDKNQNIAKANLLLEQRYLESKGLINKIKRIDESEINELELSTYAKSMNKTEDYPWIGFVGNKVKAGKYENINTLAKDLFSREFNKKYNNVSIKNGNTIFKFTGVRFNTNYTNYSLIFKNDSNRNELLFIQYDKSNGYYVDEHEFQDNFDEESKNILKDMLQYNDFGKYI